MSSHPVIEGLRRTLAKSRKSFTAELEARLRQLAADMVDGALLSKEQASGLRGELVDYVGSEVLPKLGKHPSDGLGILGMLKFHGLTRLEPQRSLLEAALLAQHPPPAAADWPEVAELAKLAATDPKLCRIGAPADNVYFATTLKEEGIPIPEELIALHAACGEITLYCRADPSRWVFTLLPGGSIDHGDAREGYPERAAAFQGEDEVQISIYRDRKKQWWMVLEVEYQPLINPAAGLLEKLCPVAVPCPLPDPACLGYRNLTRSAECSKPQCQLAD